eukprot:Transcript_23065.p1 GENE.Transcript_23065~~Transcript_23065.p1  ORF type:complete len:279 (-),score=78.35 Transcript_23065:88-873(-)
MLPLATSALTLAAAAPMEMHIARVPVSPAVSRRAALGRLFLVAPAVLYGQSAAAFDNRLPPDELELKYKTPRTPGPKPTDIGPRPGGLLKPCNDGKPHCFSSTPDPADADLDPYESAGATEGWLVSPFKYDKPLADAVTDVKSAIAAYPPGQAGIDGGGFKVAVEQAKGEEAYYIYVLFESRRRGYIDDMEFSLAKGTLNVRTSSRLGYLDMGVNAKRFNWFAARLGSTAGWTTALIRLKGHEQYFSLNGVTEGQVGAGAR